MKRELTCILCPRGCTLTAEGEPDALTVTGNHCPRGQQYAINECTHPLRTVTSSIRVANRPHAMVSVKTADPVPKEDIFRVMEQIRAAEAQAPLCIGDVLLEGISGTRIVATRDVP